MNRGPTSHTFISQRLPLHYLDWGNDGAPPLILMHGGKDHCRTWDWVAQELSKEWHVIVPDLRGHGDSAWAPDGSYSITSYVYDLAQLIHQKQLSPVTIIAHSMGGHISLRYAGIYPETVAKIVVIEGMGHPRQYYENLAAQPIEKHLIEWIETKRAAAGRFPKRYASLDEACQRMQKENPNLSAEQAEHLTRYGMSQNEDGTYSWKFDNYVRFLNPVDLARSDDFRLWGNITCPVRVLWGKDSWVPEPLEQGLLDHFQDVSLSVIENAGHWLHHDQLDLFLAEIQEFL
jgi:pimeloyl-ACP methyl ester carboxylesterase